MTTQKLTSMRNESSVRLENITVWRGKMQTVVGAVLSGKNWRKRWSKVTPNKLNRITDTILTFLKGKALQPQWGRMDFLVNDAMIGGFALAAAPAQYSVTGVKTFIVSHGGIVYEKDLGPDTLKLFQSMDRLNPDKSWHPTNDQW